MLLTAAKTGQEYTVPQPAGILVNHRPHPFDLQHKVVELPAGGTIQECLEVVAPDPAVRACMTVRLQGHVVPRENWRLIRPKPGMLLEAVPMPAGGDTLRTVLMIAIVAAAMAAGGWAAGGLVGAGYLTAGGFGFAFASAAIGGALPLGGPLALTMIPPDSAQNPAHRSSEGEL